MLILVIGQNNDVKHIEKGSMFNELMLIFVQFQSYYSADLNYNEGQLKNPDISGAIFSLNLSILILNAQCVEGARDVMVL